MTNSVKLPKIVLINELIKDPARKPFFKILSELVVLTVKHKEFPRHYFSRFLFKKEVTNVKDYCSDGMLKKIKPNFNNKDDINFLENKLYFDFYYNQFKIEIPKILMYNHKKLFVKNNRSFKIDNVEDFKIELKKNI